MKLINKAIILTAALCGVATLGSCSDETTQAVPTVNPQLPIMTPGDLTVASALPAAINLNTPQAADQDILLGTLTGLKNLPEGYTLSFTGTIGREETYTHAADFATILRDSAIYVSPDVLEGAYIDAIGKSAKPKTVYLRLAAYATNGSAQVRLGGIDTYYLQGQTTVTPLDLGIVIEQNYGLLGSINGWSVANAVLFDHSGMDPYDDPIFTMYLNITDQQAADGWWWKIVPESTIAAGNWVDVPNGQFGIAVNGGHELEGNLVAWSEANTNPGAGCVNQAGVYLLTLDMENQTYEFVPQYDYLWTPGDANGWNHNQCAKLVGAIGGTNFKGFSNLSGGFKFTDQAGWGGTNYGGADGKLDTAGGNIPVPAPGFYYLNANTADLTYKLEPITSVGLIGDFNGWGGQSNMTANGTVYTGQVTLTEGQTFKVRMNDDWGINLGGDTRNLTFDGANIALPAGTYTVTLDLGTLPFTLKAVKK